MRPFHEGWIGLPVAPTIQKRQKEPTGYDLGEVAAKWLQQRRQLRSWSGEVLFTFREHTLPPRDQCAPIGPAEEIFKFDDGQADQAKDQPGRLGEHGSSEPDSGRSNPPKPTPVSP